MIVDIRSWVTQFSQLLKGSFGERLRFVGYQGSYARGEATQSSDLDIVAVLDHVDTHDLDVYRELVGSMEQGELACGFLCGEWELRGWPLYDLYTLWLDTKPVLGDLAPLLPPLNRQNAWEALQVGAANLYHAACHTYLYATDLQSPLPELGKSAFFCLRFFALLRDGTYHPTHGELQEVLEGPSKELLSLPRTAQQAASLSPQETRQAYGLLMGWCSQILRRGMGQFQQQGSPAGQPKR